LKQRDHVLVTAESCTGGGVAVLITYLTFLPSPFFILAIAKWIENNTLSSTANFMKIRDLSSKLNFRYATKSI
ncbi:MAG: hypothetical protein AAGJ67_02190, partial [Pseudomonadota bacterium]